MASNPETIQVPGTIIEILPDQTLRLKLPNGHLVFGHVPSRFRKVLGELAVDDQVQVEWSPFDLSRGRVLTRVG
jgi:translation initiation factor IF-1